MKRIQRFVVSGCLCLGMASAPAQAAPVEPIVAFRIQLDEHGAYAVDLAEDPMGQTTECVVELLEPDGLGGYQPTLRIVDRQARIAVVVSNVLRIEVGPRIAVAVGTERSPLFALTATYSDLVLLHNGTKVVLGGSNKAVYVQPESLVWTLGGVSTNNPDCQIWDLQGGEIHDA
jgi:hypothetical protein